MRRGASRGANHLLRSLASFAGRCGHRLAVDVAVHRWLASDPLGLVVSPLMATEIPERPGSGSPHDEAREWLSLEDPHEHRTWLFDVTFLASAWTCIYGAGCPGIDEQPAPERELGCCTHGAYLTDDDDLAHVHSMILELDDELWQLRREPGEALWQDDDGSWRTRVVDGACVFANRTGHPAGAGCAFHLLAQRSGRRPMDTKPEICWQAPLRREDHETVTGHIYTMVREWERRDWGGPDTDLWWWCTSSSVAHVGATPVFRALGNELAAICGLEMYNALTAVLDERILRSADSERLLAHPAVRRRD